MKNQVTSFVKSGVSLSVSVMMSGCSSMAPRYDVPKTEQAAQFKEMTPEQRQALSAWHPAEPKDTKARGAWWIRFDDPVLNQLERLVDSANPLIAQSFANFRQAKALVQQARAAYWPTVTLNPSFSSQKGQSTSANASPGPTGTFSQYSIPLQASWEPDLWGRVASQTEAASASAQGSAADYQSQKLSQEAALATTYYELRAQDELQRIYNSSVASYREAVDLNQTLLKTGIGTPEDVVQAQTQLETAQAQATNLGIARAQYEHALALLVGRSASSFELKDAPFVVMVPPVPVGLPSQLLERRPDVAAAERNVAAANAQIGLARAAYYPSVSLTGGVGFGGNSIRGLDDVPSFIWSLGVALAETLFDGGYRDALLDQYHAQYDANVAAYKQTVLTSFQQVEDQLVALRFLQTEVQQQDAAVVSSQKSLQIAKDRYKLGLDPYLNVVQAQITLLTNQQAAVTLRLRQMISSVQLIEAVGGDWDRSMLPTGDDLKKKNAPPVKR